jgi:hypothetical protein
MRGSLALKGLRLKNIGLCCSVSFKTEVKGFEAVCFLGPNPPRPLILWWESPHRHVPRNR